MRRPTSDERWVCADNPELASRLHKAHEIACDRCGERRAITNSHTTEDDAGQTLRVVLFHCRGCCLEWLREHGDETRAMVRAWAGAGYDAARFAEVAR